MTTERRLDVIRVSKIWRKWMDEEMPDLENLQAEMNKYDLSADEKQLLGVLQAGFERQCEKATNKKSASLSDIEPDVIKEYWTETEHNGFDGWNEMDVVLQLVIHDMELYAEMSKNISNIIHSEEV